MGRKKDDPAATECIWCGAEPVTYEHLLPKWIRLPLRARHLQRTKGYGESKTTARDGVLRKQLSRRPWDHGEYVACRSCNGGWMRKYDEQGRALLKPLVFADRTRFPLNRDNLDYLARWCTKIDMTWEYMSPGSVSTPQHERAAFFRDRTIPVGWKIWIGTSEADRHWAASRWLGQPSIIPQDDAADDRPLGHNTIVTIGRLAFFVATPWASSPGPPRAFPMIPIWPAVPDSAWWPTIPPLKTPDLDALVVPQSVMEAAMHAEGMVLTNPESIGDGSKQVWEWGGGT